MRRLRQRETPTPLAPPPAYHRALAARRRDGAGPRGRRARPSGRCAAPSRTHDGSSRCRARRAGHRATATRTASRRSTPTPPTTCSAPRATSTPRTGSGRWTSAATSPPAGCPSCSARARSTTDAFLRTLGWRRVAEQECGAAVARTTRQYLQAYADGVNAWLADHRRRRRPSGAMSLEYAVLGLSNATTQSSSGPRSTRWPGSRRWPGTCAATCRTRSTGPRCSPAG